jgi:hypothetical protein
MARRMNEQGAMDNHDMGAAAKLATLACVEAAFDVATIISPDVITLGGRAGWQAVATSVGKYLTPQEDQNLRR